MDINKTIKEMTLEEKAGLCSGKNFWYTKAVERLGIDSLMLTDGPHGLRKQSEAADHLGLNVSVPSTCFPPASATGNSFDRALLTKMGETIGEECVQENVSTILGPGLNIKRSPLCGRNFEYFSEDPLVSGMLAAALVNGVQKKKVGACLKHFAVNNQETSRMTNNSVVDERAYREIYLKGFEIAVKQSQPWMIMGSYNKINSVYACENKELLTDILRKEWGFDGVTVTDWGAMNDRVMALDAGLDLEMPSSDGESDKLIVEAVKTGKLSVDVLDETVARLLKLVEKSKKQPTPFNVEKHHEIAREIAENCAVLLKNDDDILPLQKDKKICVIGQFAKKLRFQGGGSSKINPTKVENVCDALDAKSIQYTYCDGYDLDGNLEEQNLRDEAVKMAEQTETVVVFVGLPDSYESEGVDRLHINLPQAHDTLINSLAEKCKNIVVVMLNGSSVAMPWLKKVKALMTLSLPGQAGGGAAVNLLFGNSVPSGRLSETYIGDLSMNPSFNNYGTTKETVYKESVYVGYRYYNTAKLPVVFPFGYGLSYCDFTYSNLKLSKNTLSKNDKIKISVDVTNNGRFDAREVVQLYVKSPSSGVARPERELRAFDKVLIKKGETATVSLELLPQDFTYYNTVTKNWELENGTHTIIIAKNAIADLLTAEIIVKTDGVAVPEIYKGYLGEVAKTLDISDERFEKIYGRAIPKYVAPTKGNYTANATLGEIKHTPLGKQLFEQTLEGMKSQIGGMFGDDISGIASMLSDLPLRALVMFSGGAISPITMQGFLLILNGHKIRGILKVMKGGKKKK